MDKKSLLCIILYVFAGVDLWRYHQGLDKFSFPEINLFTPFIMLRCAFIALAMWLAFSFGKTLKTTHSRVIFFASMFFVTAYSYLFLLPVFVLLILNDFFYVIAMLFVFWLN